MTGVQAGVQQVAVSEDDGECRLDRFLKRRFPTLTHVQIEKWSRTGQVRVDGARAKASDRVQPGQIVRVPPLPNPSARPAVKGISPKDAAFVQSLVIYKDEDVIALNKPHGLAVQGGAKTTRHLDAMAPGLMFDAKAPPKLIHRLDRDTSGVLLMGRTPAATAALGAAFRARETLKVYWAVTIGAPSPDEGQIRGWMAKTGGPGESDREMVRRAVQSDEGAVHAITDYSVISHAGTRAAWVALRPVTGRTHQLRFHMAELGTAILGDPKYTCHRPAPTGLPEKLHLHARAIELPHPRTGKPLRVTAPLSDHMVETFAALGFEQSEGKNPFAPFR